MKNESKLIYILSFGHSGSTLLDLVIGSHPNIFSTGELTYMPWQLYRNQFPQIYGKDTCSCGKIINECPSWKEILTDINKRKNIDIFKKPLKFDISLLHSQSPQHFKKGKTYYLSLQRKMFQYFLKNPGFSFITKLYFSLYKREIRNNWLLFDSIAKEQKVEYIVDSSKDVNRATLLQMKNPQKVYPIILIRDPKGIVNSYKKKNSNIDKVMHSWLNYYNNKVKRYLNHLNTNYLVISYDELIDNTKTTRNKIYDFIGTNPLNNEININTSNYHLVAGNPLRHSLGNIEIKKDEQWKNNLSNEDIQKATLYQNKLDPIFNA